MKRNILIWAIFACSLLASSPVPAPAQVRPVNDYGAIGLEQQLRRLNTTASVMMIGAHPDDEDSALLAYLSRHDHARTWYLSLTRGDGGQNIIGPELFESLGVIRTEELLQARRLDGARQLFARAFDYGFSKALAEAREKWDEKIVVCDVVRAIRTYKPLVVISRFTGTPADGHGQHQYAGYISPIAVKAAADSEQCPGAGAPWKILKFYVEQSFGSSSQPGLKLNTGEYDPVTGRTYLQIAMEGRSQHKSQGEGRLELNGDQFSGLTLAESAVPKVDKESGIFDGLGITVGATGALGRNVGELLPPDLARLQQMSETALKNYEPRAPEKILPTLVEGFRLARSIKSSNRLPAVKAFAQQRQKEFIDAIGMAAGIRLDALSNMETVVPGETFAVTAKVYFPPGRNISVKEIALKTPPKWEVAKTDEPKDNLPGVFRREVGNTPGYFTVKTARDAHLTQPYWLDDPRDGDLFRWPENDNRNLPFQAPLVEAEVKIVVEGEEIVFTRPVQYRYADESRGEIRREINLVPSLSIALDQKLLIVPESAKAQNRRIVMSVENHSTGPVDGRASLNVHTPGEWSVKSQNAGIALKKKGEKTSAVFDLTIPAKTPAGKYSISAGVGVQEGLAGDEMHLLAYPHIQTHRYYTRASIEVNVLDLKVSPVKVGYIMGSGDQVPEAIRQMGLDVKLVDEKEIGSGDLSKYDVIVVGVRASEVRDDFVAHNRKILNYVENGGTLIVQYQRPVYAQQNLTPFPATMGARVVDENAKVVILQPEHPVFNFPNKITDADFTGWVQERNTYNFNTFDEKYIPLLESHDAGEPENKGGLVIASIGKGNYIYCSYSFFRQLPSGVSGAYRLFANLLSLPKGKRQ
jgi:LmbE family N-acetylglucosaminyl deacetylase